VRLSEKSTVRERIKPAVTAGHVRCSFSKQKDSAGRTVQKTRAAANSPFRASADLYHRGNNRQPVSAPRADPRQLSTASGTPTLPGFAASGAARIVWRTPCVFNIPKVFHPDVPFSTCDVSRFNMRWRMRRRRVPRGCPLIPPLRMSARIPLWILLRWQGRCDARVCVARYG